MFIRNDKFKKAVEILTAVLEILGLVLDNNILCYIAAALNLILTIL